jgi:MtN3 and saliva related transmembrane protein
VIDDLIYDLEPKLMLMNWEIVGATAAVLTMFGFVPQITKIYRTKSVEDVSLTMLIQYSIGLFLWMLYGIYLENNILIFSNLIAFSTLLIAVGLYLKYRKNHAQKFCKNDH